MSKYYKAEDIMEFFSDENRPYNCMGTAEEIQEQVDFNFYKSQIESLPKIDIVRCEDCIWRDKDNQGEYYCTYAKGLADIGEESFCSWGGERIDEWVST